MRFGEYTDNKRIWIALAVVWILIAAYNVWTLTRPVGDGASSEALERLKKQRQERAERGGLAAGRTELTKLRLDLLEQGNPPYKGVKKNIFSPVKVVAKPRPVPTKPKPVKPTIKKPAPKPSPIETFKGQIVFAGFLEKEGARMTVFLSRGDDIFLVKGGDVIDGRFKIVEITKDYIKFMDTYTKELATILLGEG